MSSCRRLGKQRRRYPKPFNASQSSNSFVPPRSYDCPPLPVAVVDCPGYAYQRIRQAPTERTSVKAPKTYGTQSLFMAQSTSLPTRRSIALKGGIHTRHLKMRGSPLRGGFRASIRSVLEIGSQISSLIPSGENRFQVSASRRMRQFSGPPERGLDRPSGPDHGRKAHRGRGCPQNYHEPDRSIRPALGMCPK
jgi:hypothetical protein